jgi:hypothetical protein
VIDVGDDRDVADAGQVGCVGHRGISAA